jgi:hypothetical protein
MLFHFFIFFNSCFDWTELKLNLIGQNSPIKSSLILIRILSSFSLKNKMEALVGLPFNVLEVPNLKLKKPPWVKPPSAMVVFALVLLSYFLVTGGN